MIITLQMSVNSLLDGFMDRFNVDLSLWYHLIKAM